MFEMLKFSVVCPQTVRPFGAVALMVASALFGLGHTGVSNANPGDLDPTFGSAGLSGVEISPRVGWSRTMLILPDGKILVTGQTSNEAGLFPRVPSDFNLVRYHPDGTPDQAFGQGGSVFTDLSGKGSDDIPYAMALQPDGQIVLAGTTFFKQSDKKRLALVRYHSDGSLDPQFGRNGLVRIGLTGTGMVGVNTMVIQPDGKVLAGGHWGPNLLLLRFAADGRLDRSFGNKGVVKARFGSRHCVSMVRSIALQSDGRIVVAGEPNVQGLLPTTCQQASTFALARFQPNGRLDDSFGQHGRVLLDFPGFAEAHATALLIQPDGKLVVSGSYLGVDISACPKISGTRCGDRR